MRIAITSHASFLSFETSDGRKGTEPYAHGSTSTKEGLIDCDCGGCGTLTMAVARVLSGLGPKDGHTIEYIDGHGSLIKF